MKIPSTTTDPTTTPLLTRRTLLGGTFALGAGAFLAACSKDKATDTSAAADTAATTNTTASADTAVADTTAVAAETSAAAAAADTSAAAAATATGDAAIAQLAAGLEVLAVNTYKAALDAATAGKLGDVPAAVATFATTAMEQHQKHLDAWNAVLTKAGATAVTEPNAKLQPTVDSAFAAVTDVTGVAKLALLLEETAAATYLSALPNILDKDAVQLAGSMQITDRQHAAILHYVLGEYPVPDTFQKTDLAVS